MRTLKDYEEKMVASAYPRFQSWQSMPSDVQDVKLPAYQQTPSAYAELYELVAN